MDLELTGKRVLVTGGSRGIGRAITKAFLDEGARVAINGRTAESVAQAMPGFAGAAIPAPGDVSTAAGCKAVVLTALLINVTISGNGGIGSDSEGGGIVAEDGGVTLQGQVQLRFRNTTAIVYHANSFATALLQHHFNICRTRIKAVFDQFLEH